MFGKMMNNYYYGKSGKGDFRKEDLPETRMQLFWATLRTRLSGLCRLNLMYAVIWIPAMVVLFYFLSSFWGQLNEEYMYESYTYTEYAELMQSRNQEAMAEDAFAEMKSVVKEKNAVAQDASYEAYLERTAESGNGQMTEEEFQYWRRYDYYRTRNTLLRMLLFLFPCIAITGPFTAGVSYVTRNWARDEHAFIWTDFKDAMKANWKQSLAVSALTGFLVTAVYVGWDYYGEKSAEMPFLSVVQVIVVMIGAIWAISVTYMHPTVVTYDLKLKDVFRNGLLFGVARLPFSIGIRLLHCVPLVIAAGVILLFNLDLLLGMLLLGGYYLIIGFGLSRFITASYTNAVFDRFINSRVEGAKVNQGLRDKDDDDEDEEDEEKEEETVQ